MPRNAARRKHHSRNADDLTPVVWRMQMRRKQNRIRMDDAGKE
jgi:hypothetical protein